MIFEKRRSSIVLGVIILPFIAWWAAERLGWFQGEKIVPGVIQSVKEGVQEEGEERRVKEFELTIFTENLSVPWSAVFTSSERLLVTERAGRVRIIENGVLKEEPLHTFSSVSQQSEEGLMGMALDPHYNENKYLYFAYAYPTSGKQVVRVVRLTDQGNSLGEEMIILDNIPAAQYHAGTRIAFGPDQKLYITTGDATDKKLPQDKESLGGKILRVNADGSAPEDNPFEGNLVFSYGHRNSQGIAWDTRTRELYASEHGPSVFDGPAGGDEINHILPGSNYGWPLVSHKEELDDTESPMIVFTPAVAPAGMLFYTGDKLPQFTDTLLFTALKGEGLYQVIIDNDNPDEAESYQKIKGIDVGRVRDVFQGPDGSLYIMTSNQDGRGQAVKGGDKIYLLKPKE